MGLLDKIRNKGKEAKGKAEEKAGNARGDESQAAKGRGEQSEANLKQAGEKGKDALGDAKDSFGR